MAAAPGQVTRRNRSALIVDDSKLACAVLSRLLEQEGYDSEFAGSGQEALQRARDQKPDVIFMDHLMPGMTGLDAVRALKSDERTAKVPVVMFSSQEDEEFLAAAREAGASAVLTKHTERTNLGQVLKHVGRQWQEETEASPARAAAASAAAPPAPSASPASPPPPLRVSAEPRPVVGLTRADLRAEIEPMLRAQRDQIHTELLAEFAILEGHQESMRRTLTGRLEILLRRTVREVTEQLTARLAPPPPRSPRQSVLGLLGRAGVATAALALLAIPVALVVEQGHRLERMSAATADIRAAVDNQSRAMGELGRQVESLGQQVANASADLQLAAATEAALRRERQLATAARAPTASAAPVQPAVAAEPRLPLAELLAASGIEGPVELRTALGSFCLELQGTSGYRLAPMGAAGSACVPGATLAVLAGMSPAADLSY